MNVGSLFSGIGGVEIGFEAEGFTTEWFVEYEPYAATILKKRFPNAIVYGDITTIDFRDVPKVDILTGGFPCQDISNAGKRAGITGSRSSLWKYYLEAIRILRPKYAIIENVSAILDRGLNVVLSDLASVGYDAEWHCISASAVGALHRRDRIIIIAYPDSSGCLYGQAQEQSAEGREQTLSQFEPSCSYVENSLSDGIGEGNRENVDRGKEKEEYSNQFSCPSENVEYAKCIRLSQQREYEQSLHSTQDRTGKTDWIDNAGWWAVEPELGRVAHGVPNRVDRIKCLGNAVVPQLAQVIAQAVQKVQKEREANLCRSESGVHYSWFKTPHSRESSIPALPKNFSIYFLFASFTFFL